MNGYFLNSNPNSMYSLNSACIQHCNTALPSKRCLRRYLFSQESSVVHIRLGSTYVSELSIIFESLFKQYDADSYIRIF